MCKKVLTFLFILSFFTSNISAKSVWETLFGSNQSARVDSVGLTQIPNQFSENVGNAVINVERTGGDNAAFSVDYTTLDNSATAGIDYVLTQGTLNFAAGETAKQILVPIIDDGDAENSEYFAVQLSNATNGVNLGNSFGFFQIDPDEPIFIIFGSSGIESNDATIEVYRQGTNLNSTATVDFATSDDTAIAGQDYVAQSGTLTFAPNEIFKNITISVINDAVIEANLETFFFTISNPSAGNGIVGTNPATYTINDDDQQFVYIQDANDGDPIVEGNNAVFNISRQNGDLTQPLTVDFTTVNGTATSPTDYTAQIGTVTFAANETDKTVTVETFNDFTVEPNEQFSVELSNASGGVIITGTTASVTLTDNNTPMPERLAFASRYSPPTPDIFAINDDNSSFANLSNTASINEGEIDYNKINGKIVFRCGINICTMDVNGSNRTTIYNSPDFSSEPSWSPNGQYVVFDNGGRLGLLEVSTNTYTDVVNNGSMFPFNSPRISPDNSKIAFIASDGNGFELYVVNLDGTNLLKLTNLDEFSAVPDWSPDGSKIVFASGTNQYQTNDIYTVNADGTSLTNLTNSPTVVDESPQFSPDGTKIAFSSDFLSIMNPDGTSRQSFSESRGYPSWSPSGTKLAFHGNYYLKALTVSDGNVYFERYIDGSDIADMPVEWLPEPVPAVGFEISSSNITEGDGNANIVVNRTGNSNLAFDVNYATASGTATSGDDFNATNGTLNFAIGETSKTISVPIIDDVDVENTEDFSINLSGATNDVQITTVTHTIDIFDNEPTVSFAVTTPVIEGNDVTVTLTRTGSLANTSSVYLASYGGSAIVGEDYNSFAGTISFAAGETEKTVTIQTINDMIAEFGEDFFLEIQQPVGCRLGSTTQRQVIITDDEPKVAFSLGEYIVQENAGTAVITVNRTGDTSQESTITYRTIDSNTATTRYVPIANATMVFAVGETSKTFSVIINNDNFPNGNSGFFVRFLTASPNTSFANNDSRVIIINDENSLFQVSPATRTFVLNEPDFAEIVITRSGEMNNSPSIGYTTQGNFNPATAGEDYPVTTGVLNFAPNETSKIVQIPIINDTIPELDEQFQFYLQNPTNGGYISGAATIISNLRILGNDRVLVGAVSPGNIGEGAGSVAIQVTRTEDLSIATTVSYTTADGYLTLASATAGQDYTAVNGTLNFAAGEATKTVTIPILDDSIFEINNEGFSLILSNPSNGTFITTNAGVVIIDNDARYTMAANSLNVSEGAGNASVVVTRLNGSGTTTSVNYEMVNGSAISPFDYTATNGTLTFAPSENSKTILIPIIDDVASETDENFYVRILPSSNAAIVDSVTYITINDNDPKISMSSGDYSVAETAGSIDVQVVRIGPTNLTATVNYTTQDGSAVAGQDYTAVSGTIAFNAGELQKTVTIPILSDNIPENESFSFVLSNPNGAILQTPSSSTIRIIEPAATNFYIRQTKSECPIQNGRSEIGVVSCSDYAERFRWEIRQYPGSSQSPPYYVFQRYLDYESVPTQTVTVTRTGPRIDQSATVNYSTSNVNATAGSDYVATSGTLNFAPNETSKTFDVQILNDSIAEGIETLNITLSNPTNDHFLGTTTFPMAILDSFVSFNPRDGNGDEQPTNYFIFEGNTDAAIPVYRYGDLDTPISIDYRTDGGTATANVDYTAVSGTLIFGVGEFSKSFLVPILSDAIQEGDENVGLFLSNVSGESVLTDSSSNLDIRETVVYIPCYNPTDSFPDAPCIYGSFSNITTGESTPSVQIKVRVAGNRNGPLSVDYATANGTAIAGQEYTATSGTLTFADNETEKFVIIPVLNDSILDSGESFTLNLSNLQGSGATLLESNKTSTITLQDACLSFAYTQVSEGNTNHLVNIFRGCDNQSSITVNYSTSDGTATAGSDYTAVSGSVTFAPNETAKTFIIPILDDNIAEQTETINLNMSLSGQEASQPPGNPNAVLIAEQFSNVQIQSSVNSVNEDAGFYTATVIRNGNINHAFSVSYATSNVSATAGQDYTATSGTLNFAAGELFKTFQIPIANDTTTEADETFRITLLNATGEAIVYGNTLDVSIIDNDTIPKIKFQFEVFSANEAANNAQIGVVRTGDSTTAVSVNFATSNGTATAGNDYTATNATINFASGETLKYVNIPLLNDAITEGGEFLNLTLSSSTGATIQTPNSVRLNITEIKPRLEMPNWTLTVASSGGLLSGKHLAGIAANTTNKELYVATDTGQLQNTEELYFDLYKVDTNGNQSQIGRYFIPHYDLVNLEFNATDGQIYTIGTDKVVYKINPANGNLSVFNSNIGLTFFRYGLEFNAANELIFMPENNPNSFYRVNSGSGLTTLGSVTADNNSNYGTRFGIQPDGDYVIFPDGTAASNPRITEINKTSFAFNYLSPTNIRTLGSAFGHSIGAVNPVTGDVFSSGGNFGNGSSVILFTGGASSLAVKNKNKFAGTTVPFVTKIGNNTIDGTNNLTAKGVTDMDFGPRRDNASGQCLYFVDDVDETVYQACMLFAPSASTATISGRVTLANGRGLNRTRVSITNQNGETKMTTTNPFGYFRFADIEAGQIYVIQPRSKTYQFTPQTVQVDEDLDSINFVPLE